MSEARKLRISEAQNLGLSETQKLGNSESGKLGSSETWNLVSSIETPNFGLYRYVTRTNVPFFDLTTRLGLGSKNGIRTFVRVT